MKGITIICQCFVNDLLHIFSLQFWMKCSADFGCLSLTIRSLFFEFQNAILHSKGLNIIKMDNLFYYIFCQGINSKNISLFILDRLFVICKYCNHLRLTSQIKTNMKTFNF